MVDLYGLVTCRGVLMVRERSYEIRMYKVRVGYICTRGTKGDVCVAVNV